MANLIGTFNQQIFAMINRIMLKEICSEKMLKFFDRLVKLLFTIFNNEVFSSILNSLFDHSVLHSIINLISSQVYNILDNDINVFSIKQLRPKRFLEIKADQLSERLKEYLEKEIICDWICWSQQCKSIKYGTESHYL